MKKSSYALEVKFELVNEYVRPKKINLKKVLEAVEESLEGMRLKGFSKMAFFHKVKIKEQPDE